MPTEKRKSTPPGMMLYLASRPLFEQLEPETLKRLLLAMFDYCGEGTEPELDDPMLRLAWAAVKERLDADRGRYRKTCLTNRFHRFLQEARLYYPPELCPDYEDWLDLSGEGSLSAAQTLRELERRLSASAGESGQIQNQ